MILVTGGTGFVGSHLVGRLAREGIETRCLVRSSSKAGGIETLGMEAVVGDVTERRSLADAVDGVDAVVHLVGIIREPKGVTFELVHSQGTRNLVEACLDAGVERFIYISALGTRPEAPSRYHKTKWEAEEIVRKSGMEYTILRPSIMFGARGEFVEFLKKIIHQAPLVPVVGGSSLVQPIHVENTVDCIIQSIQGKAVNRTVEIGGPEQMTYRQLFKTFAEVAGVEKTFIEIPIWLVKPLAYVMEAVMDNPPVTSQQLIMLGEDNICDNTEMLKTFKLELISLREGLKEIL